MLALHKITTVKNSVVQSNQPTVDVALQNSNAHCVGLFAKCNFLTLTTVGYSGLFELPSTILSTCNRRRLVDRGTQIFESDKKLLYDKLLNAILFVAGIVSCGFTVYQQTYAKCRIALH